MSKILKNSLLKAIVSYLIVLVICFMQIYIKDEYGIEFKWIAMYSAVASVLGIPVLLFFIWVDSQEKEDLLCLIWNYINKTDKAVIEKLNNKDYSSVNKHNMISESVKYELTGRKRILPNKKVQFEVEVYIDELSYNYNHYWEYKYKKWIDKERMI